MPQPAPTLRAALLLLSVVVLSPSGRAQSAPPTIGSVTIGSLGQTINGDGVYIVGTLSQDAVIEWLRDGVAVPNATSRILRFNTLPTPYAGNYAARVTISGTTLTSNTLPENVVNAGNTDVTIQEGLQARFGVNYTGPVMQFQWVNVNDQPLEEGDHFHGTQTSTLTINQPGAGDAGSYSLVMSNIEDSSRYHFGVNVRGRPVLTFYGGGWRVGSPVDKLGSFFSVDTIGEALAVTRISGLPPGIKFNGLETYLTGSPTQPGIYTMKIQARNQYGLGPLTTAQVVVEPLPENQLGTFNGLIARDEALNNGLGGSFTLTTTASGTFSGKLTRGRAAHTFSGRWNYGSATVPLITNHGLVSLALNLSVDANGGLSGELVGASSSALVTAIRSPWRNGMQAFRYAGTHIAALPLDPSFIRKIAYPQGTGYFGGSIGLNGVFTAGARFADNTVATISTTIGQNQTIPFHWLLYNGTGSVQGWGHSDGNSMDGEVDWSKHPQTIATRSYKAGFTAHRLGIQGGRMRGYSSPSELVLGWQEPFQCGVDVSDASAGMVQNLTLTFGNVFQAVGLPIFVGAADAQSTQTQYTLGLQVIRDQNKFTGTILSPTGTGVCHGIFVNQMALGVGHVQVPESADGDAPLLSSNVVISPGHYAP